VEAAIVDIDASVLNNAILVSLSSIAYRPCGTGGPASSARPLGSVITNIHLSLAVPLIGLGLSLHITQSIALIGDGVVV